MADTAKISNQVGALRKTFSTGKTRSIAWRQEQLRALKRFIREREKELYAALKEDLHKSEFEAFTAELAMVIGEADLCIKNLPKWSRAKKIPTIMAAQPGKSYMVPEPQGVVLIIGAWNYPVQLTLVPLVGAIAGGNCAVIKPSEVAPATSKVIAQQLPNYLDKDAYCVVEGAVDETTALLEEKFDHYFYTGNGRVGSIVMAAAAKHLGQVTLELGGKSPCIVDHTADLDVAAKRIAWGKFYNAGQTCVAPDYVMVEKDVEEPLLANLRDAIKEFYGEDPKQSDDYCRIVNERHHQRLAPLLKSGEAYVGGEVDEADRYIAPTVLRNVSKDSAVMEDEIFGPILPVVAVNSIDEATDYLRAAGGRQGRPLLLTLIDEDSLYLAADTLVAFREDSLAQDSLRTLLAYHDVRIFKEDLQGICDSLVYRAADSMFRLFRQPVLWSDTSQFNADTVHIQMANDRIDRILFYNQAFMVNTPDEEFFNQVKGRFVVAFFREGKIDRMRVSGNAESIYYALDDEDAYLGVNKTVCSEMRLAFQDGKVQEIRFYNEPKAQFIPFRQADHEALRLPGFFWEVQRRPRSLEDLFSGRSAEVGEK